MIETQQITKPLTRIKMKNIKTKNELKHSHFHFKY